MDDSVIQDFAVMCYQEHFREYYYEYLIEDSDEDSDETQKTILGTSKDTDISLQFTPKGTGVISVNF
jgi:hypothetical protein